MQYDLQSNQFSEYIKALHDIRDALDDHRQLDIDQAMFEYICAPFELYKFGLHQDILDQFLTTLKVLMKYESAISTKDMKGVVQYLNGFRKGKYDASGFIVVMSSLEMAVYASLDKILKNNSKLFLAEDIKIFQSTQKLLKSMEGACHVAYDILRHIGNEHLEVLRLIIYPLEPVHKRFILRALDVFKGDLKVIDFYKDYIQFFKDLKMKAVSSYAQRECDRMIEEAEGYLKTVTG
jgi:hypothetical protein